MSENENRRPHKRSTHPTGGPVRTKQGDTAAADAEALVRRWLHGEPITGTAKQPSYGDFSNAESFHEAMIRVTEAEAAFMELPAPVRRLSDNDPGKFLDLVHTDEGRALLREAGMREFQAPAQDAADSPRPSDQLPLDPTPPDVPGGSPGAE